MKQTEAQCIFAFSLKKLGFTCECKDDDVIVYYNGVSYTLKKDEYEKMNRSQIVDYVFGKFSFKYDANEAKRKQAKK
jgi:hypothetical protein